MLAPMSSTATPARKPARRIGFGPLMAAVVPLGVAALALLAIEGEPRVAEPPPDAAAVTRARDMAESLRDLLATDGAAGSWTVDEATLNGALASGRRVVPGVAGRVRVEDAAVIEVSAGSPWLPEGLWANLRLDVAPSDGGLRIAAARIGRLPLPPWLVEHGLRLTADRLLGDGLGSAALDAVAAVTIAPPEVTVRFEEAGRAALFERLAARARAATGSDDTMEIHQQLWFIDKAGKSGDLPHEGSMLPWLRHAVTTSLGRKHGGPMPARLQGALLALMIYCGDADLGQAVGVELSERRLGANNHCDGTTLAGRDDLKRHFVVSAGIQAAASGRTAFGLGELKELLDSNLGGSGFSFDDMAADIAGARFAAAFLAAPPEDWPAMLAMIESEADVLPSLDGLPSGLSEAEFRTRYGDVDSAAYRQQVAEIEARVDALPLHRRFAAPASAPSQ
jgi:hypothetical protein